MKSSRSLLTPDYNLIKKALAKGNTHTRWIWRSNTVRAIEGKTKDSEGHLVRVPINRHMRRSKYWERKGLVML